MRPKYSTELNLLCRYYSSDIQGVWQEETTVLRAKAIAYSINQAC